MIDFQAIILAAGCGTRMNLTTQKIPKCLLEIGKTTILDRQIDILLKNGIEDILIVTGYKSDLIKKHLFKKNVKIIYNKNYKKYDNLFSIWCVRDLIKTNFICIYGDLIFDEKLISSFLQRSSRLFNLCRIPSSLPRARKGSGVATPKNALSSPSEYCS